MFTELKIIVTNIGWTAKFECKSYEIFIT